jgi:cell division septation protein DedD
MKGRLVACFSLAAALAGCGGQHVPATAHHLPAAIATPPNDAALLRVSRSGGTAQLLRANTLTPRESIIPGGLPTMSRILGASGSEDQTVYGADNSGRLVAIDLKGQRSRLLPTSARQLTAALDGTILGVDSAHRPVRFSGASQSTVKATVEKGTILLRGPGDQILAVGNRPGTLQVLGTAGEIRHVAIPGGQVTATWVGDLVAVITDSGVLFVDPSGKAPAKKAPPRFVRIRGVATVAAFSPSGHRLYVARKTGGLMMVDRYTRAVLKQQLPLGGTADALRADRSGRWLLAHAGSGDSLWVIDLSRWTVAWSGVAPWSDDLPQVVDGQTLLIRRKADVVAIDLGGATPPERGLLVGGATDLYIMLPWVPKSGQSAIEVAATPGSAAPIAMPASAPQVTAHPDTGAATPPASVQRPMPPPTPAPNNATTGGKLYVQVSSSQNQEWAQALAKQLKDGGFPATVLEPKTSDESYRVVIGPYLTREDADAVGKRLGRSYFIITPGSGDG